MFLSEGTEFGGRTLRRGGEVGNGNDFAVVESVLKFLVVGGGDFGDGGEGLSCGRWLPISTACEGTGRLVGLLDHVIYYTISLTFPSIMISQGTITEDLQRSVLNANTILALNCNVACGSILPRTEIPALHGPRRSLIPRRSQPWRS